MSRGDKVEAPALRGPLDGGLSAAQLAVLERYGGKRGRQALTAITVAQIMWPMAKKGWGRIRRREDFTITVPGLDPIYPDLHEWVLERMPEVERKAMIASTAHTEYDSEADGVMLRYDGSREQKVEIDGNDVAVKVERERMPDRVNLSDDWRLSLEKVTFTAKTVEGRDAVVRMVGGLVEEKRSRPAPPSLYMPTRWGGEWNRRGDLPPRSLPSVILKEGQLERLMDDFATFLTSEEEYNRLSLPWHRGYLFFGEPGTGKTSLARALADMFALPTYYLPLGDMEKDANLIANITAIRPRSLLLLEDADVFGAATERSKDKDNASLSAMLNSLDGAWTPHGLITVMTTNNRDALDPALVRPGRIDVEEEFTALDLDQAERLAEYFGCETCIPTEFVDRSPAEMIEHLKRERSHKWARR